MKTLFFIVLILFLQPLTSFAGNWELIDTNIVEVNRPRNLSMSWADVNHGVVYHDIGIFGPGLKITTDCGESWKILNIDSIGKSLGLKSINNFYLADYNKENLAVALNNAKFLFSSDNGITWSLKNFPYGSGVTFLNFNKSGTTGILYETNDQGIPRYLYTTNKDLTEFKKIEIPEEYKWYSLNNFVVYNDNLISCIGADAGEWIELIWIDNGVWTKYDLPHNTCNVSFIDSITGFTTGFLENELSVCKTINGGKNWEKIYSDYPANTSRYFGMLNDKVGIIAGYNYMFLKTTDGGYTWNKEQISNYPIEKQGTFQSFYISGLTLMDEKSYLLAYESLYRNNNITSVNEKLKNKEVNNAIYPNPIEKGGNLSVRLDDLNFSSIQICSLQGMNFHSFDNSNSQIQDGSVNIDLPKELSSGIYILKLISGNKYQLFTFIIQ